MAFAVIAILMTVAAVLSMDQTPAEYYEPPDALSTALTITAFSVLAFLRRWPLVVLVITLGSLILHSSLGYDEADIAAMAGFLIITTVAVRSSGWRRVAGLVVFDVGVALLFLVDTAPIEPVGTILANIGVFSFAWVVGVFARSRVDALEQAKRGAEELAEERDYAAAQAAAEERNRIARELHDAVGHTLNLIVVQAGAARRVRDTNPGAAYDALKSIENTGRQALSDMDRMLGILREQPDAPEDDKAPRPGLARLSAMLDEAQAAGVPVNLEIQGEERKLPVSIDLTAYRVVQEGITNVIKHAPGAATTVCLRYEPQSLGITVANGPAKAPVRNQRRRGRGLAGMRERVLLFGGSLEAVPVDGGGFSLRVALPLEGVA